MSMARSAARDMTIGSPVKLILGFFTPLLLGLLFQQFYNMVDTIVVGKFLGVNALAGVGSTGSINFLVLGFCIGVSGGFVIPVAQKFGEKDFTGLRRFVGNAIWLSGAFALVMTVTVCLLCRHILAWMNTPPEIMAEAYGYIFVIFLGIPITYAYNILSGVIRSTGDSRAPVIFLVISSLFNVGLDLLTVMALGMGVEGTAWATVISQAVASMLCLFYIRRSDILQLSGEEWQPDRRIMKKLIAMGVPMGLQYSITAIGSIVLQTAVNGLGAVYVASVTAGSKVSQIMCCPFDAMGSTMATYGGQNVGAKKLNRIRQGLRACSVMGVLYSLASFAILFLWGDRLALLFLDARDAAVAEVIRNSWQFLKINAAFYIPLAFVNIVRFLIQGMGFSKQAVFAGVCEMAARVGVSVLLVPVWGYNAICLANPAAWVAADLFLFPAYGHAVKQLKIWFRLEQTS